ncbi:hypothetical protein BDY24DRAFT_386619 [Mrakia frigida]|uniref:uncharacterized protein n=1 Tax=Mrakia frigida TaxID=29902 RepID=UPI003FCC1353
MESLASVKLEPFLLIAKGSKGALTAKTIQDAISAPGVFVFSELLALPRVQELSSNPQHAPTLRLLELFAYGTWSQYQANPSAFPPLTPHQITKLKHLTLVSLAKSNRTLPYSQLLSSLSLSTVRALEDFLIEGMYHSLIKGKMDQQRRVFLVDECIGRDVDPNELAILRSALETWAQTQTDLITQLSYNISAATKQSTEQQSQLLLYQMERDAAIVDANSKSSSSSNNVSGWGGGGGLRSSGSDDWDMAGGGFGSGFSTGGGKAVGGGTGGGKGKKPLMASHGSPAHARKKNKN